MSAKTFIERQLLQIQQGGRAVLFKKMKRALWILLKLPLYILSVPVVLVIRLIRPWLLVRLGGLISCRIGHLAANTELYLCERDAGINTPKQRHVDLFYMAYRPICNQQLAKIGRNILELHIHDNKDFSEVDTWGHFALKGTVLLDEIKDVLMNNTCPIILEHGNEVSEEELLSEKRLIEEYIKVTIL